MRVDVSGKQFVFPRQCACCGRFPGTRLTISGSERNRNSRTRGWAWDIPYCHDCVRHVRLADRILIGALSLVALAGIVAFIGLALGMSWLICLVVFSIASGVTWSAVRALFRNLRKKRFQGCTTLSRSVQYLGSSGSWHSFDFESRAYLSGFVRANRLKVVNASASISSMLREVDVSEYQVARRLTRHPK